MAPRVIPQGAPDLPPPGDARREVLRERTDDLAEAAEAAGADRGTIDPRAFEVDNEIGSHFNDMEVPNARPDSCYCWVQCGASWYGRYVNMKRAEGWTVVKGTDDDAPVDTVQADNTCRVGDVLLMRTSIERYVAIARRNRARQRAIEQGTLAAAELTDVAEQYRSLGVEVKINNPERLKTMSARSRAALIAQQQFERQIRDGYVAGMPVAGRKGR